MKDLHDVPFIMVYQILLETYNTKLENLRHSNQTLSHCHLIHVGPPTHKHL